MSRVRLGRVEVQGDGPGGEVIFPWQDLLIYVLLRFLQGATGSMGVINNIRAYLWIPVEQYTRQEISASTFAHMHQYVTCTGASRVLCARARRTRRPRMPDARIVLPN